MEAHQSTRLKSPFLRTPAYDKSSVLDGRTQFPNEELWRRTQQRPIPEAIKERKWRWVGHTLRRDLTSLTKQALDWNTQEKRRRGRPTTIWRRSLDTELRTYRISWGEAKHKAQDRTGWKAVVKTLCSGRDDEDLVSK